MIMDFVPAEEFEQILYEMRKEARRKEDELKEKNDQIELLKEKLEIANSIIENLKKLLRI